ncbi:CDP-diacylglycerol--serine O-phosphatidyltransferase [Donghicola sp. C2-DW-16]|uniref:CDP-diacylglycerol--serine O-phosphatidyltransferase n=1 Tax=Donghicola mangrovi TaxID=2729614 RepID=A0A850Q7U4_9RHOB|nr:CDP-diacylglycerol--serine O-phosphatidyltransferase [Donghicola mangrovi]NVO25013.1 CDP-diacylglycerol--serine O-phosphatidyltransferase [Donghicola mangrovi]NVO28030.1 CDP-diacylglycerol--serine O-phosphatidyltransferase [Donghicola mangrovi]
MTTPPRRPIHSEKVPFLLLVPNMVTLAGMCLGLTSIRFSMDHHYAGAVTLILLASVMDGLDGLLARRLNATSKMGSELDSLSDFLCFGVAPGVLLYKSILDQLGTFGWVFVLIFAAATCLRLARFNVMKGQADEDEKSHNYFVGVPAPGGAYLAMLPLFLWLGDVVDTHSVPTLVALWMAFTALLMISTLKTLSPKALRVPRPLIVLFMFAVVVGIGVIFTRPFMLLVAVDSIYVVLLAKCVWDARGRFFS